MVVQLFEALVETVGGQEERRGVGDVDSNRHVQRGASFPHGVEARVVDLYQCAGGDVLAQVEAEGLQDLQAAGSVAMGGLQLIGLRSRVAGFVRPAPHRLGKGEETAGIGSVVAAYGLAQSIAVAAGEIHHGAEVSTVHDGKQIFGRGRESAIACERHALLAFRRERQVRVDVDDREPGALHFGFRDVQHALRLVVAEIERLLLLLGGQA